MDFKDKMLTSKLSSVTLKVMAMVCLCANLYNIGNAQEYTRTFVKEVVTQEYLTVSSNVPSSLTIQLDGVNAYRSNTLFGYIIKGSNDQDRLYINKDYNIDTWDKNMVRQEVDVTIRSKEKRVADELLGRLEIKFHSDVPGQITIDANMNLEKFEMRSKRFKSDHCLITLDSGDSYEITYLEIKTRLFIPRKSNLKINSILHHTLRLGDLDGNLDLDLQYGEVYGKRINNLYANLRFCFNVIFEEANNVMASATNSYLKIDKVNEVDLGKIRLGNGPLVHGDEIQWLDNNSSMNIYEFRNAQRMIVHDSATDDFRIGEVENIEVSSSIYSDFEILRIDKNLIFNGKNGDLSIAELGKEFETIDIRSKLSKLNINVAEDDAYRIKVFGPERIEQKLPARARLIEDKSSSHLLYEMGFGKSTAEILVKCDRCELDIWE